jgi:endonuclease/exonuclease/phosphatase family metal-dependent hydrolase
MWAACASSAAFAADLPIHIFWWNIHWGSINTDGPKDDLQESLSRLVQSSASPDVLAFGEYSDASIGSDDLHLLQINYPFYQEFPYPGSTGEGVAVFSKYPFQVMSVDPIGSRSLIILNLNIRGVEVTFVPVHIEDAWREFYKKNGKDKTIEQIFIGTHNPVWDEIVQFRSQLEARLGDRMYQKNFVMIGDFNSIKPGRAYDRISWDLRDPINNLTGTFPATQSIDRNTFPVPIQIDHAFVSPSTDVRSAEVLPLLGSDHYALYMTFDP